MKRDVAALIMQSLLAVTFIAGLVKRNKVRIDKIIVLLLACVIITEILALNFFSAFNLDIYRAFAIVEIVLFSYIYYQDTKTKLIYIVLAGLLILESVIQLITDYSLLSIVTGSTEIAEFRIRESYQFFDLATLNGFIITLLTFHWIWWMVNKANIPPILRTKRFIYAFSMLLFFGGSFFTIAFSRLLLPDTSNWQQIWYSVYTPLYLLYYTGILTGLLWKTSPQSSS